MGKMKKPLPVNLSATALSEPTSPSIERPRSSRIAERLRRCREEDVDRTGSGSDEFSRRTLSTREKESLLIGLRRHGSRHPTRLTSSIRTRSEEVIRSTINKCKGNQFFMLSPLSSLQDVQTLVSPPKSCRPVRRRSMDTPAETWISLIEGDCSGPRPTLPPRQVDGSPAVVAVLDYIAKCEGHPDPAEVGGVNYAAIYESLAALMCGEVPKDLNKATSGKILEMMGKLMKCVTSNKEATQEQRKHLELYRVPDGMGVVEPNPDSVSNLNILKLPQSFFSLATD